MISQHDTPRRGHLDCGALSQAAERARYCFNGETEIISDVLSRHRKFDRASCRYALGHLQEKGCDALLRALDQQQHVCLGPLQFARRERQHVTGDLVVTFRNRHQRSSFDYRDLAVCDRLSRECMLLSSLKAEDIAGHMKCTDLAASVR